MEASCWCLAADSGGGRGGVREHIGELISLQIVVTDGVVEEIVEHIVEEPPPKVLEAAGVTELTVAADMEVTFDAQAPQPWSRAICVEKGPRRRKRRHGPDSEDQMLDEAKKQAEGEAPKRKALQRSSARSAWWSACCESTILDHVGQTVTDGKNPSVYVLAFSSGGALAHVCRVRRQERRATCCFRVRHPYLSA